MKKKYMTQEEKQLLLQDLSARLPYGVKIHCEWNYYKGERAREDGVLTEIDFLGNTILFQRSNDQITRIPFNRVDGTVKPYLRPMSSMTKEERKELNNQGYTKIAGELYHYCALSSNNAFYNPERYPYVRMEYVIKLINWLNSHHFDYRGLIEKGLAIEVTEENNPYEN